MQRDGGPGGAGGAGNPVGGGFTGPAEALEIYGDFASALSGGVVIAQVTGPETNLLNFTTGNYVFVGNLQMFSDESSGNDIRFTLSFNGATIAEMITSGDSQYQSRQLDSGLRILIPAYTEITLTAYNATEDTNRTQYAVMVGRIYRG